MGSYPLVLTFAYTVDGDGYTARVSGATRLLARRIQGEWVCSAVSFGGVQTAGATLREAHESFLTEVRSVVLESASGLAFSEFEQEVLGIAATMDAEIAQHWGESLDEFRRGAIPADGMEKLRRISESDIAPVTVQLLTAPGEIHEIRTELTIPMNQSRAA